MKPSPFTRYAPATILEATQMLTDLAPHGGRILAGGQSLMPMMAFRLASPAHLIDINRVKELEYLAARERTLCIGALTRHGSFCRRTPFGALGALLSEVAKHISHYAIRTRGTFCGSLAHADPASEWCLVSATLGAQVVLRSTRMDRIVDIDNFLEGIMATCMQDDELLAEVRLPILADDTKFGFYEFCRRAGDFAQAATLVTYRLDRGMMRDVRLGLGGAEDKARRNSKAELILEGNPPSDTLFIEAADAAALSIEPLEDAQTTAQYRRELVRTTVRRALASSTMAKLDSLAVTNPIS
jgi:aerobic carbon-monoxide dehydrogenase medium subunit